VTNDALIFRIPVVIFYIRQKSDQVVLLFCGQLFQQFGKALRVLASVSRCGELQISRRVSLYVRISVEPNEQYADLGVMVPGERR